MYEIAGGVDDAGGGGLTALLGCPSEGSGVFVLLRLIVYSFCYTVKQFPR